MHSLQKDSTLATDYFKGTAFSHLPTLKNKLMSKDMVLQFPFKSLIFFKSQVSWCHTCNPLPFSMFLLLCCLSQDSKFMTQTSFIAINCFVKLSESPSTLQNIMRYNEPGWIFIFTHSHDNSVWLKKKTCDKWTVCWYIFNLRIKGKTYFTNYCLNSWVSFVSLHWNIIDVGEGFS